jgi:hypothetical protein
MCSGDANTFHNRVKGLIWKPWGGGRSTFDGRDRSGRHCGSVTNMTGRWTIYPDPGAATDEYVAAHLAGEGEPP